LDRKKGNLNCTDGLKGLQEGLLRGTPQGGGGGRPGMGSLREKKSKSAKRGDQKGRGRPCPAGGKTKE